MKKQTIIALLLITIGLIGRLVPHLPNVVPITAIALFAAAYLHKREAIIVFFVTMFVSDVIIGFYQWQVMMVVYLSFFLVTIVGRHLRNRVTAARLLGLTLASSFLFFVTTNWAVWQFTTLYPRTLSGLIECYTLALPFLKNSLMGDVIYSGLLFGIVYIISSVKYPVRNFVHN